MKHYLLILSTFIILFSSCSKEDDILIDDETSVPTLCVKRIVDYNQMKYVYDYEYDGTKLVEQTVTRIYDNDTIVTSESEYIYQSNLITTSIINTGGTVRYYDFEYDNQGRVTKQFTDNTLTYTYNYLGYLVEQYDSSGNLLREQTYDSDYNLIGTKTKDANDTSWTYISTSTHDNKNMLFKNVDAWSPRSIYRYISPNNTNSVTVTLQNGNSSYPGSTKTMNIIYDMNDFPIYIETLDDSGVIQNTSTLEYNN
jgi:YD repeat-containing protein